MEKKKAVTKRAVQKKEEEERRLAEKLVRGRSAHTTHSTAATLARSLFLLLCPLLYFSPPLAVFRICTG